MSCGLLGKQALYLCDANHVTKCMHRFTLFAKDDYPEYLNDNVSLTLK